MNRRTWTRAGSGLVAALAAAALVGLAAPAHADETPSPSAPAPTEASPSSPAEPTTPGGPTRGGSTTAPKPAGKAPSADLSISVASSRIALGATEKVLRVDVRNEGPAVAQKVTVVVDVAALSNDVDVVVPSGYCKINNEQTKATCSFGELPVIGGKILDFRLVPRTVSQTGPLGTMTMSISSDTPDPNAANNTDTVDVSVSDRGVDLMAVASDISAVKPGRTAVLDFAVRNFGSRGVDGVSLKVTLPQYVSVPANLQYFDCTYSRNGREIVCRDDVSLAPGEWYTWHEDTPFLVSVSPDAPGPVNLGTGLLTAAGENEFDAEAVRGSKALRSVVGKASRKSLTDADPGDNSDAFRVTTAENPADLAVTASKANGNVGDTVTVTVKVTNNGPADSSGFTATVTAPDGTELVNTPKACAVKTPGKVYVCQAGNFLDKGEVAEQDFSFKITSAKVGGNGKVAIAGKIPDRRTANNTAKIRINDTGGGGGGGLPVTGAQVSLVAGAGAALLLAGAAMVLLARRRRTALALAATGPGRGAQTDMTADPVAEPAAEVKSTGDDSGGASA